MSKLWLTTRKGRESHRVKNKNERSFIQFKQLEIIIIVLVCFIINYFDSFLTQTNNKKYIVYNLTNLKNNIKMIFNKIRIKKQM